MTAAMIDFAHLDEEVFSTSAHTMHADLMGVIVNSCKAMPNVWQKMSQEQQQDFLDSIDSQVKTIVESCVKTIAASGKPFVLAKVDQVTFKGGIEAKLKIERDHNIDGAPSGAHELADNTGELVMIILPGLSEYEAADGEKPQAEDDQPDLMDSGSDELYDDAVAFVQESGKASISAVQRYLRVGYNRAARLIEIMERAGVVGPLDDKGQRQVIG